MTENGTDSNERWSAPALRAPSEAKVKELSESLGLECTKEDINVYTEKMQAILKSYQRLHEMVEPTWPVKYPRTPGYRPQPEENVYNAWYYRCDIKGADPGKLSGKTVGIKDNTAVAGVPMMCGSKIMDGYVPEFDATVVTRILDAGGRILGKAACEDLCYGAGNTNTYGPVINPVSKDHFVGGSSSGCAALVAAGEVDMALGADQGGSIRIPASWCGIVGLKPTYGLVPYTGCMPLELTLDHCGPMTRTVYDCALMLEVLAGYDDGSDPRQPRDITVPEYTQLLTEDLKGKRIGLVKEGFRDAADDVKDMVRTAAQSLVEAGATVEDISIPMHTDGYHIWRGILHEGAYQTGIRDCGHTVGWKGRYFRSMRDRFYQGSQTRSRDIPENYHMLMMFGEYLRTNYPGHFYAKCQNLNQQLTREYDKALEDYDVLVMPTLPYVAKKVTAKSTSLSERLSYLPNVVDNVAPFNATGHPALSINVGLSKGLPVGMMICGRRFDDATVLQVAYAFEKLRDKKSIDK